MIGLGDLKRQWNVFPIVCHATPLESSSGVVDFARLFGKFTMIFSFKFNNIQGIALDADHRYSDLVSTPDSAQILKRPTWGSAQ
jgi:hypothetical protein